MSFDLATPLSPLSKRERLLVAASTIVVTLSRIFFRARSPWDWDEILFALALDDFDVPNHHPHPPGFPLFVGAAKIFVTAGLSHFHALQLVNLIAGALLIPAMFLFCRELRMKFAVAVSAALLFAVLPNVWFFGETAFSDVPSVVLALLACGLLLRGCRSGHAYLGGAVLLAVAAGFRPQNLVIGLLPAVIATWHQLRARAFSRVALAILAPAAIVVASYWAAAHASGGWKIYREAVIAHQEYIRTVDSFRSPTRPPLQNLVDDFFVRPFRAPLINTGVAILALISAAGALLRRRWPVLIAIGTFGPFAIAAWLVLDHMSASRFSIGYAPLFALLPADGIAMIASRLRTERSRVIAQTVLTLGGIATMTAWTLPAVNRARAELSPPFAAVSWIRANLPTGSLIYADSGMGPYSELFLRDYRVRWLGGGIPFARLESEPAWGLGETTSQVPHARNFAWPRTRLWNVARQRYFESSVAPIVAQVSFLDGWYGEESDGRSSWRWMGTRSETLFPALSVKGRLTIRLFIPIHAIGGAPQVTVSWNGRIVDRFAVTEPYTEKTYDRPAGTETNRLVLETDRVANQARQGIGPDDRDLGMRIDRLEWVAVRD
ncbi:MAG: hypothetical protein JJE51_09270 [Thermoanaerobaculia bacterium]|nr:hypothetical protein [Thermoanaerobaculia bacterium]